MKKNGSRTSIILGMIAFFCILIIVVLAFTETYCPNASCYVKYKAFISAINGLSMSMVISYLFYMIALIPDNRRQKSIGRYIKFYLSKMNISISEIQQVLTNLDENIQNICVDSPKLTSKIDSATGQRRYLTYEEHLIRFYTSINELYNLVTPYTLYMEDDIRDSLFSLINSEQFYEIKEIVIDGTTQNDKNIYLKSVDVQEFQTMLVDIHNTINGLA